MTRGVALVLAALLGLAAPRAWADASRGLVHPDVEVGFGWERRPDGLWGWGWLGGRASPWRGRWEGHLEREHFLLEGWLDDGHRPFRLRLEAGPERR
jgi:hypothetical protein